MPRTTREQLEEIHELAMRIASRTTQILSNPPTNREMRGYLQQLKVDANRIIQVEEVTEENFK